MQSSEGSVTEETKLTKKENHANAGHKPGGRNGSDFLKKKSFHRVGYQFYRSNQSKVMNSDWPSVSSSQLPTPV